MCLLLFAISYLTSPTFVEVFQCVLGRVMSCVLGPEPQPAAIVAARGDSWHRRQIRDAPHWHFFHCMCVCVGSKPYISQYRLQNQCVNAMNSWYHSFPLPFARWTIRRVLPSFARKVRCVCPLTALPHNILWEKCKQGRGIKSGIAKNRKATWRCRVRQAP
jgi:hypothetical protein